MKPYHSPQPSGSVRSPRRCRAAFLLILVLTALPSFAAPFDHAHTLLDQVLQKYVASGLVDYRALKSDQDTLNRYLQTLTDIDARDYTGWTRPQKLALWINAYNAYTLRAILDHYPIGRSLLADPLRQYPSDSIRQIPGVWSRLRWKVMGRELTLDHMEHVILRKQLVEPRIHFVLVCASLGCPLLESRAFDAGHLEERLGQAARNYIYRDHKVRIDARAAAVRLPQIFKWFAEDFTPDPQSAGYFARFPKEIADPLAWVYRYANAADRVFLRSASYQVSFIDYDWALNDRR